MAPVILGVKQPVDHDPVMYWSRRQFIHEETDETVTKIHANASDLLPPPFFRTRKQAQRMRQRTMSDDERHRRVRRQGNQAKKPLPTAALIRRESTKNRRQSNDGKTSLRTSNSMEVLKQEEPVIVEPKRRSRRSRRREPEKEQGTWKEVKQAGVTFWLNDTTGVADEDPPPIRNPDGTFKPRMHTAAFCDDSTAEEIMDDESTGDLSFAFLEDWTQEKKYSKW